MQYFALTLPGGKTITAGGSLPDVQGGPGSALNYIKTVITKTIVLVLIVGIVITLIYLILGGMQWVTSQGEKDKVEAARKKLTFAIIGLLVILLSFAIVALFGGMFGIDLTTFSF